MAGKKILDMTFLQFFPKFLPFFKDEVIEELLKNHQKWQKFGKKNEEKRCLTCLQPISPRNGTAGARNPGRVLSTRSATRSITRCQVRSTSNSSKGKMLLMMMNVSDTLTKYVSNLLQHQNVLLRVYY